MNVILKGFGLEILDESRKDMYVAGHPRSDI
jgi:hypothetical protein